jgi:ABC-type cobalamin/Fe3+-siderophores transport system ATPase subunit
MTALLSLRKVCLSYRRGRRHVVSVLANASLDVHPGEIVAVIAQRGQGKTSLLHVAAGIEKPTGGEVVFNQQNLWELSDRSRSRMLANAIALVEHDRPEVDLPSVTRVALPLLRTHTRCSAYAQAMQALEHLGAQECAEQLWGELSDWERALVALACGIVQDPKLLLIDDLAVRLGIGATEEIGRLLRSVAQERSCAVLMSVSDAGRTTWSDRIATLAGGELLVPSWRPPDWDDKVIDFPEQMPERAS